MSNGLKLKKISKQVLMMFFLTLTLCSIIIIISINNRYNADKMLMDQLIKEKSSQLNAVISGLLYKTETLSALVVRSDGNTQNFDKVAAIIFDSPALANVLLAPDGIVSDVYPKQGNEAVIGYNLLGEGEGNIEAIMAKESGKLIFGGPFHLMQGGQALVGRLPVYLDEPDGNKRFWGLVSVTLEYPQVLDDVRLSEFESAGFLYEIWRISPDTNDKQTIAKSERNIGAHISYIEEYVPILNAGWYFRIAPARQWYGYPETWLMIVAGISISFLVSLTSKKNIELKLMRTELENMVRIDALTQVYNRGYFMDLAAVQVQRSMRLNNSCFIVMMDIDHFKKTNDTYGHTTGDKVLENVAQRMRNIIRPYDLIGRYGGEEFIMLISDLDKQALLNVVERIRLSICEDPMEIEGNYIDISASFGVVDVSAVDDFDVGIKLADSALYVAKKSGRNKVVFYTDEQEPVSTVSL
ncbi:MAG: sensor domain-containing diguanylate cyclase [Lacrimispora sp.]